MTCSGRDCYVDANQENIIKCDLLGYDEAYLDFEEIDRQDVHRAWRIRWNLNDQQVVRTGEDGRRLVTNRAASPQTV